MPAARAPRIPGPRPDWGRGARALVAVGFSFGVASLISGLQYGTFAALGCYIDAYGARDPYPRRGRLLLAVAGGAVAFFLLGSLAAADTWPALAALPAGAVAATLFIRTLHISGPGSYSVIIIGAVSGFLPFEPGRIPLEAGYLLLGAATSWLLSMSGRLSRPHGPEERSVSAAYRRVADFAEAADREDRDARRLRAARQTAYRAVHGAWTAIDDVRKDTGRPGERRLVLYALLYRLEGVLDAVETVTRNPPPPGGPRPSPAHPRLLRAVADDVAAGRTPELPLGPPPAGVPGPPPAGAGRVPTSELLREADLLWPLPLPPRKSVRAELRGMLAASSPTPAVALRLGCAVAAGAVLGALLPLVHPAWVTVGAAAALQGGPGQQPVQRSGKRLAGTVVGVAATALAFHSYQPGVWATVAVAALVHAAASAVTSASVFLRMALNTPFALLIAYAGTPDTNLGTLAAYRLLDLTLGLLLGLAATLPMPGVPRRRVRAAVSQAVEAAGDALRERLRTGAPTHVSEGLAWQRAADLSDMHASVPVEEIRSTDAADRLWPTVLAVRRLLAWNILSRATAPAPAEAERVGEFMASLAVSARTAAPGSEAGPRKPATPRHPPELPGHPVLHARLRALAEALTTGPRSS